LEIGGKHKINLSHINLPDWLLAVRDDRNQLQNLLDHSKPITPLRDAKLAHSSPAATACCQRPAKPLRPQMT
jgi:hypothetical protein